MKMFRMKNQNYRSYNKCENRGPSGFATITPK